MASSTFPDDDGYKSPIFLYLAYHGKNEMQQTNMDLEDQYAFGEDPGLLENLEIGDDDTQEDDPCNFTAETPGEATLGDGRGFPVSKVIALDASDPEILIIATPDIPGPDESA